MSNAAHIGRGRLGSFGWGVGFGFGLVAALGVGLVATLWSLDSAVLEPFNVEVRSNGRDVSTHGGMRLEVLNERGRLRQSCRGGCDDLQVLADSSDNSFTVRVLDASDNCVACTSGIYVTHGLTTRLAVEGPAVLRVVMEGEDQTVARPEPPAATP